MRAEKQLINDEYLVRLKESPFFMLVDYQGLKVDHFAELRHRLSQSGAEVHVVKNSIFRLAAQGFGVDLAGALTGQLALVTGEKDISSTAKVIKTFAAEFDRPQFRLGFLEGELLEAESLARLADLPPLDVLRGKLLGVLQAPASYLVRLLNTPASQVARVIKARVDQENS